MPKVKTHSGAKKRFRVTGSGKIAFQKTGRRHNAHEERKTGAHAAQDGNSPRGPG